MIEFKIKLPFSEKTIKAKETCSLITALRGPDNERTIQKDLGASAIRYLIPEFEYGVQISPYMILDTLMRRSGNLNTYIENFISKLNVHYADHMEQAYLTLETLVAGENENDHLYFFLWHNLWDNLSYGKDRVEDVKRILVSIAMHIVMYGREECVSLILNYSKSSSRSIFFDAEGDPYYEENYFN